MTLVYNEWVEEDDTEKKKLPVLIEKEDRIEWCGGKRRRVWSTVLSVS